MQGNQGSENQHSLELGETGADRHSEAQEGVNEILGALSAPPVELLERLEKHAKRSRGITLHRPQIVDLLNYINGITQYAAALVGTLTESATARETTEDESAHETQPPAAGSRLLVPKYYADGRRHGEPPAGEG